MAHTHTHMFCTLLRILFACSVEKQTDGVLDPAAYKISPSLL